MKLKTVTSEGKTYAEVQDGRPVYVADDGKEIAFDAVGTAETIKRLNGEAKGHREGKEAAEARLAAFEGISDPAAAIKALNTVKNLDDKKLVEAGEVEKVKAEAIKAVEEKYAPVVKERDQFKADLFNEKIGGSFARSPLIVGDKAKLAIPADIAQSAFGKHFSVDAGKIIAKDGAGNQIFSKSSPGNPAEFDEALEILVDAYPHKDQILKGTGGSGTGKTPGQGGQGGKDLSHLSPVERINAARASK